MMFHSTRIYPWVYRYCLLIYIEVSDSLNIYIKDAQKFRRIINLIILTINQIMWSPGKLKSTFVLIFLLLVILYSSMCDPFIIESSINFPTFKSLNWSIILYIIVIYDKFIYVYWAKHIMGIILKIPFI